MNPASLPVVAVAHPAAKMLISLAFLLVTLFVVVGLCAWLPSASAPVWHYVRHWGSSHHGGCNRCLRRSFAALADMNAEQAFAEAYRRSLVRAAFGRVSP